MNTSLRKEQTIFVAKRQIIRIWKPLVRHESMYVFTAQGDRKNQINSIVILLKVVYRLPKCLDVWHS